MGSKSVRSWVSSWLSGRSQAIVCSGKNLVADRHRTDTPERSVGDYIDQQTYNVRLSGNSDKRLVRLVSALRGEAKADAGHIMAIFIADFRTSLQACSLVGDGGGYMYSYVSCI